MGISISKPEIYLGNKKTLINKISKNIKKSTIDKIGFKFLHQENKKNIIEMAEKVGKKSLRLANIKPQFLIFVCQGQDKIFPSAAEELAYRLNLDSNTLVLTISAGCSGFVQSLIVVKQLFSGDFRNGIIICAEKYSKYMKKNDLKTRLLFSDAASATIVKKTKENNILNYDYGHDGQNGYNLQAIADKNQHLEMNGNEVFVFGINKIPESIKKVKKNFTVDYYLIHIGSKIMLDSIALKSNLDKKKIISSYDITGNTVSTSIPVLINKSYKIFKNKNILLTGFGVGLSWSTLLLKWI